MTTNAFKPTTTATATMRRTIQQQSSAAATAATTQSLSVLAQTQQQQPQPPHHVVIVGAGVSGLACAHHLLKLQQQHQQQQQQQLVKITLVEASFQAGGRVWASSSSSSSNSSSTGKDGTTNGFRYDMGAEFIHGRGTVLTELLDELGFGPEHCTNDNDNKNNWQDFCIASHADGGPTLVPSSNNNNNNINNNHNYYARYYIDGQLREAGDPRVQALTDALHEIFNTDDNNDNDAADDVSVGQALSRTTQYLSAMSSSASSPEQQQQQQWHDLVVASFGNTAGCTDLNQLSLPVLRHFERHWDECEESGDYQFRIPGTMRDFVDCWVERLLSSNVNTTSTVEVEEATISATTTATTSNIQLLCHWPVQTIRQDKDHPTAAPAFQVVSREGLELRADWVVVTVPPPLLLEILEDPPSLLSDRQRTALQYVGWARVVKLVLCFDRRLWPAGLQSLIVADRHSSRCSTSGSGSSNEAPGVSFPIPEMWFRDDNVVEEDDPQIGTAQNHTRYIMVGYLTSQLADDFIAQIQQLQRRHRDETNDDDDHSHPLSRHDAAATLATAQLAHMFHCPVTDFRAALQHAMIFDWHDEDAPYIRGGYMHPLRGMTVQHLRDLAEPASQQRRLLLAGEATNANACCTLQAAMETGIRAARTILEEIHTTSTTTTTTTVST